MAEGANHLNSRYAKNMTVAPTFQLAITFVFITLLLVMVGFGLLIPAQPALISQLAHVAAAQASIICGFMFLAFSAGQFLCGPTLGTLSDTYGPQAFSFCLISLGPRVPFYVVGAITLMNFVFGTFILPEILSKENRRPFDWPAPIHWAL